VIENTRSEAATALIFQTSEVLSINFNLDEGEVRGRGDLHPHSSLARIPRTATRHAEDRLRTHERVGQPPTADLAAISTARSWFSARRVAA